MRLRNRNQYLRQILLRLLRWVNITSYSTKQNPVFDDFETAIRRVTDSKLTTYRHISLLLSLYSASLNTQCGSSTPAAPGLSRPFKIYSHQIVGTISLLLPLSQLPCHLSFITSPLSFLISLCLVIRVSQLQTIHNSLKTLVLGRVGVIVHASHSVYVR